MAVCHMITTNKSQFTKNMAVCDMITTCQPFSTKQHGYMSHDFYL